ncbi:MAG: hypothetical protein LUQ66_03925 [Methanoregula sp.]|nr:hypothetical protein [Methanoregula sp.]
MPILINKKNIKQEDTNTKDPVKTNYGEWGRRNEKLDEKVRKSFTRT